MSEQDFKKTYNSFTKFVTWGTIAVIIIVSYFSNHTTLNIKNYK